QNAQDEFSQSLRCPDFRAALGLAECRKVHGYNRAKRRERFPCRKKGQYALGQRAEKQYRIAILLLVCGKSDSQPVNGPELHRAESRIVVTCHADLPPER